MCSAARRSIGKCGCQSSVKTDETMASNETLNDEIWLQQSYVSTRIRLLSATRPPIRDAVAQTRRSIISIDDNISSSLCFAPFNL